MFNVKLNKTYEITTSASEKIVLIAKLVAVVPGGFLFLDEIKNDKFALSNETVVALQQL